MFESLNLKIPRARKPSSPVFGSGMLCSTMYSVSHECSRPYELSVGCQNVANDAARLWWIAACFRAYALSPARIPGARFSPRTSTFANQSFDFHSKNATTLRISSRRSSTSSVHLSSRAKAVVHSTRMTSLTSSSVTVSSSALLSTASSPAPPPATRAYPARPLTGPSLLPPLTEPPGRSAQLSTGSFPALLSATARGFDHQIQDRK